MSYVVVALGLSLVTACGATSGGREVARHERTVPLEMYRGSLGAVVAFAASGKTVVESRPTSLPVFRDEPEELALVERSTGRVLGSTKGFAVGQPADGEAYALVDQKLVAMVSKREAPIEMPAAMTRYHWRLLWSTVDHRAGTALLLFDQDIDVGVGLTQNDVDRDRNASRFELVEIDTNAMSLRGHATISRLGSRMTADDVAQAIVAVETENGTRKRGYGGASGGCALAASGAQMFVTCRKPEAYGEVEHWVSTRYDGRTVQWSVEFVTPPGSGSGEVNAEVTGDGKTLVLAHGSFSNGGLDAETTILIDTASGRARSIARTAAPPGRIGQVVTVPNTSFVAQIHRFEPSAHRWGSPSFDGISLVDGTTGAIRVVLDTASKDELRKSIPDAVVVLPNGTYLLAIR